MSSRAKYVIIRSGVVQAYYDKHGGTGCALALIGGPDEAALQAELIAATKENDSFLESFYYEGGYLIDFDEQLAIVFGQPDVDLPDLEHMDLGPETTALIEQGPAEYFAAIAPAYRGWTLRWNDRGVDAFLDHLSRRGLLDQVTGWTEPARDTGHPPTAELIVSP